QAWVATPRVVGRRRAASTGDASQELYPTTRRERRRRRPGGYARALRYPALQRNVQGERRAAPRRGLDPQVPPVCLQDFARNRETEAGALARRLRREEPVEDLRLHLGRDPGAVVDDLDLDHRPAPAGADGELLALLGGLHCLPGVAQKIHQDLAQA